MINYKKIIIPVAAVAAVAIFAAGMSGSAEDKMVSKAEYADIKSTIDISGKVGVQDEITYYSKVNAYIQSAAYDAGDDVHKDDVIASYDMQEVQLALDNAKYNASMSENAYEAASEENNKNKAKYDTAAGEDNAYRKQYEETIEAINNIDLSQYSENTDIKDSYTEISNRILELNEAINEKTTELSNIQLKITLASFEGSGWSMKFLESQGETIQNEIKDLNNQVVELQKQIESLPQAQMNTEEYEQYLKLTTKLNDITRDWTQAKTDKATAEAKVQNDKAVEQLNDAYKIAKLGEDDAQRDYDYASGGVVAQKDGIVLEKYITDGQYVTKGTPLYKIADTSAVIVTVEVSKYDIEKVLEGQKAQITIGTKKYDGEVAKIYKTAVTDSSDKAKVKTEIKLNNADDDIILGLEADVVIYTDSRENVLCVPTTAVYSDDNGTYCYVSVNKKIEKKYIQTGAQDSSYTEITDGISEGETVITDSVTDSEIGEKINEKVN